MPRHGRRHGRSRLRPAGECQRHLLQTQAAGCDRAARPSRSTLGGGMMSSVSKALEDDGARRDAISLHDRLILVEAGAGSGKTAVMAGRIAVMLAEGIPPRAIAPVPFTQLAASRSEEHTSELQSLMRISYAVL